MSSVAFVNNFPYNFNHSCSSDILSSSKSTTPPSRTITGSNLNSVDTYSPLSHAWPPSDTETTSAFNTTKVEGSFDVFNYASMTTSKKIELVRDLIDITAELLGNIWGKPSAENSVLPLNLFVQETIKRSQSSYCTLLTALLYVFRIKDQILKLRKSPLLKRDTMDRKSITSSVNNVAQFDESLMGRVLCARRMFLAALILASKFLQDRNYTNGVWAKTLGLNVDDINVNETAFLRLIDYRLFVSLPIFTSWSNMCMKFIQTSKGKRDALVKPAGQALHSDKWRLHTHSGPYPTTNSTLNTQELVALLRGKVQKHRAMKYSPHGRHSNQPKEIHAKYRPICQLPSPSASP